MANKSILGEFLVKVNSLLAPTDLGQAGATLAAFFVVEPGQSGSFGHSYDALIELLRNQFPPDRDNGLEDVCTKMLTNARNPVDNAPWKEFVRFMVSYLQYLPRVDIHDLLETYTQLEELVR
jgi:hypothetical protein